MRTTRVPAAATLPLVVITVAALGVVGTVMSTTSVNTLYNTSDSLKATQATLLADSAMEEALLGLHRSSGYSSTTFSVPEGNVGIVITNAGADEKQINIATSSPLVKRILNTTIQMAGQTNPLSTTVLFASDDVALTKSTTQVIGNIRSNDNVDLDNTTIVYGDIYTSGAGNGSKTRIQHTGKVLDNPNTPETEGNVYAIDEILVNNNGQIQNVGKSKVKVTTQSGGTIGTKIVDSTLTIPTVAVPVFSFAAYKTQAQQEGTYFNTPTQFLTYLTSQGNTTSGGIFYIGSTSSLTFAPGTTYNITGTIISDGDINVQSLTYNHTSGTNLPALASKRSINFTDQNNCACVANVTGALWANQSVTLKHDQYTGGQTFAVTVTGAIWAGDDATLEDRSQLIVSLPVIQDIAGFNFGGAVSTDNLIEVLNWDID